MDNDNTLYFLILIMTGNVILSLIVAWAASQRGHGSTGWFFLSLFISPILALLVLMAVGSAKKKDADITDYLAWKRAQAAAHAAAMPPIAEGPSILRTAVRRTSDGAEFQLNISEIRTALADGALSLSDYYFDLLARTWLELAAHPRLG
jgi:hypothetical protein